MSNKRPRQTATWTRGELKRQRNMTDADVDGFLAEIAAGAAHVGRTSPVALLAEM